MTFQVLVMAKAPVPGRAKTRLGAEIGMATAAGLASAALLDTLEACAEAVGPARCHLALDGDLQAAADGAEIGTALAGWRVRPQVGDDFAARLAHAHAQLPGPVVQVGMDTPQLTASLLHDAAAGLEVHDAVLGPAVDGGWWVLALRDPRAAGALVDVPMSTSATGDRTRAALEAAGLTVGETVTLRDVDTVADAELVASEAPGSRFARTWATTRDGAP